MSNGSTGYHFLPWVRFGVMAGATQPDTLDPALQPRLKLPVKLRVNPGPTSSPSDDVSVPLTLYGPGDVIGIDRRDVIRTDPPHLTPDFPPHLFASVEFDRPDFPWMFTPASANANRLRPWVVLVVVKKASASLQADPGRPLVKLTCPTSELPDLTESWLWAHGLYVGGLDSGTITGQLAARPNQAVSRLLCPRRLEASQGGADAGYYACVVPAFEVGRKAGLGLAFAADDATSLRSAWDVTVTGSVELPVYYQWEFGTGSEGDFEDAVDRLQMLREPPDTPPPMIDVSDPGGGLGTFPNTVLPLGSALRPAGQPVPPPPAALGQIGERLRTVLETPLGAGARPNPPVYGQWQASGAGAHGPTPLAPGAAPPWLGALNLDPRRRVAAALGAQVVQQRQEQLVASAWAQAGEADAVNQWLRQKQLGREVTRSVFDKRLSVLSSASLQQITAPLAVDAPAASRRAMQVPAFAGSAPADGPGSPLPDVVVSPAFRRLARPFGPVARASGVTGDGVASAATRSATARSSAAPSAVAPAAPTPADTAALLAQLDPQRTFALEAQSRVQLAGTLAGTRPDALAPVMLTPTFPQAMYEPLRDLFSATLLPGLDRIPNNSVMLLDVDAAFIEAYMAGLNDELSRELLWREFPTDLRGTYFRQFWDVSGQLPPTATEAERERLRDIPPIGQWQSTLGANMPPSRGPGMLLLLFKGDLLLRFPTVMIYAARGAWATDSTGAPVQVVDTTAAPVLPHLRFSPAPGATLLGFALTDASGAPVTSATVAGGTAPPASAGWFFVLEEHPTEPRFGLDLTGAALTTWRELAWTDVATRADRSGYISVRARTPVLVAPPANAPQAERDRYARERTLTWGRDAAVMGYITLQKPFRQEVHAGFWFDRQRTAHA